jgi:hypothetical protein
MARPNKRFGADLRKTEAVTAAFVTERASLPLHGAFSAPFLQCLARTKSPDKKRTQIARRIGIG